MTKEDIPTTATAPSSMGAPPMKDDSNKEGFGLENSKAGSWSNQFLNKYPILAQWKSRRAFVTAQYQVFGILASPTLSTIGPLVIREMKIIAMVCFGLWYW